MSIQMRVLSVLGTLVLLLSTLTLSAQNRFKYSLNEADSVLIDLNNALKEYHPFAYRANGSERLDSILLAIRAELPHQIQDDSIHVADLIQLASTFNEVIGDGHLQLTRKRAENYSKMNKLFAYDFHTRFVENEKIVLSDTLTLLDSATFYPGTEVLTFQGEPAAKIYARLGAFIGLNDHDRKTSKTFYPALNPASFYQRLYGWKDSLTVELRTDQTKHQVLILPSARIAYLNRDTTNKSAPEKVAKLTRKVKKQQRITKMKRIVNLDTTSADDVYILKVRSFSNSNFEHLNHYRYTKKLMKRLDSLNAKGLIVDVRHNTGGSLNYVNYIYSMMAEGNFYSGDQGIGYSKRAYGKNFFNKVENVMFGGTRKKQGVYHKKTLIEKNKPKKGTAHFSGEVIVLVNEGSFSGGTCLPNYVQQYKRGKVIGQAPGGSAERMYAGTLFKKAIGPEESLLINMPLWFMNMPGESLGNVNPDVLIPITTDMIVDQRDGTLEEALKLFSFVEED